jgi:hypothetical protein
MSAPPKKTTNNNNINNNNNNNNVVLLCGERRVKTLFSRVGTEKITSDEGHEWFLESPQVKIMFLLS